MKDKIRSAIYGFAVGDAFGVPYEFKTRDTFSCGYSMMGGGSHGQLPGTWSDDTSMVLATMDALTEGKDLKFIMDNFIKWYSKNEYTAQGNIFDMGNTVRQALCNYLKGYPIEKCGLTEEYANGNGSLMRILPLAFLPYDELFIDRVSALTHNTTRCKLICEEYVKLCKALIDDEFDFNAPHITGIEKIPRDQIKSTGYVIDSFIAALWSFLTTTDYAECIMTAVNLGNDTDTIAAIAGGLAGLYYGYEDIPKIWIDDLANKKLLDDIIEKFTKTIV